MPSPANSSAADPVVTLGEAAQRVERYMRGAEPKIARRALWWASIRSSARAWGVDPGAVVGPELAAQNDQASVAAVAWGRALRALDSNRAELVPYQQGDSPIVRFAVGTVGGLAGELGWWSVALKVLQVAAGAVLSGGAWLLGDAYLDTRKNESEATRLNAELRASLADAAQRDPRLAQALAEATGAADAAAAGAGRGWLDTLTGAAGASFGGGALALGVVWWLTRKRKGARE